MITISGMYTKQKYTTTVIAITLLCSMLLCYILTIIFLIITTSGGVDLLILPHSGVVCGIIGIHFHCRLLSALCQYCLCIHTRHYIVVIVVVVVLMVVVHRGSRHVNIYNSESNKVNKYSSRCRSNSYYNIYRVEYSIECQLRSYQQ